MISRLVVGMCVNLYAGFYNSHAENNEDWRPEFERI